MDTQTELSELSGRIDDLVQRIEFIGDPAVRANVVTLVQALMDLHRRGFERVATILSRNDAGREIFRELAADELVNGLLLLYSLHPDSTEARLHSAIEKLREDLRRAGSSLELIGLREGVALLRLKTSGNSCTAAPVENQIKDAIYAIAPDVVSIEIEKETISSSVLVQLQVPGPALRT